MSIQIDALLKGMVQFDASDLHVKVGMPPGYRISGCIQPLKNLEALTAAWPQRAGTSMSIPSTSP